MNNSLYNVNVVADIHGPNTVLISVEYKIESDTLDISLSEELCRVEDRGNGGLFRRFSQADGKPIGVTIVGFLDHWRDTKEMAYSNISAFLRVDVGAVRRATMPLLPMWSI
jgi:hypothetical protein